MIWWNNGNKPELKEQNNSFSKDNTIDNSLTKELFELTSLEHSSNFGLFNFLYNTQDEDYKEEQFANRMNKKKEKNCNLLFVLK